MTDGPLLVLAIGSMPFLLLEIRRDEIPRSDVLLIDIVNVLVLVAFAVDYIVELALARNRRRYIVSEWSSLAIVVSQGLALAPSLAGLGALRVFRAGRLWRVLVVGLRVVSLGRSASHEARAVVRQHAFRFAILARALHLGSGRGSRRCRGGDHARRLRVVHGRAVVVGVDDHHRRLRRHHPAHVRWSESSASSRWSSASVRSRS